MLNVWKEFLKNIFYCNYYLYFTLAIFYKYTLLYLYYGSMDLYYRVAELNIFVPYVSVCKSSLHRDPKVSVYLMLMFQISRRNLET